MRGLDFELKLLLLFGDWLLLFWWASLVMMGQAAELVEWKQTTQGTNQSESSNDSHLGFGQPGFRAHWLQHAFSLHHPRDLHIACATDRIDRSCRAMQNIATRHSCNPYIAAMYVFMYKRYINYIYIYSSQ